MMVKYVKIDRGQIEGNQMQPESPTHQLTIFAFIKKPTKDKINTKSN